MNAIVTRDVPSIVVKANLLPTIPVATVVLDRRVTQIGIALLENVVILAQINIRQDIVMCFAGIVIGVAVVAAVPSGIVFCCCRAARASRRPAHDGIIMTQPAIIGTTVLPTQQQMFR